MVKELNETQLEQISGGGNADQGMVGTLVKLLSDMGLDVTEDFVISMMNNGGLALRNWALAKTGGDKRANMIPSF